MSISGKAHSLQSGLVSVPRQFRGRLTFVLASLVTLGTVLVLVVTQRIQEDAAVQSLQNQFQRHLGYVLGQQRAHEDLIAAQCRQLAQSARIQKALETQDWGNLYSVTRLELAGLLATPQNEGARLVQAEYIRLLSPDRVILAEAGQTSPVLEWEKVIAQSGAGKQRQEIGFLAAPEDSGFHLWRMVATPVLGQEGRLLATLVLGFPVMEEMADQEADLNSSLWLNGKLYPWQLGEEKRRQGIRQELASWLANETDWEKKQRVRLGGESWLLFHTVLNAGSAFPPARLVCFSSLAEAEAQQGEFRYYALLSWAIVLMAGLWASHLFSKRLSQPVEALEEESRHESAARREAEEARSVSELKYRAIFENAVEGIFVVSPQGVGVSYNPAMARLLGYETPEELLTATRQGCAQYFASPERATVFLAEVQAAGVVSNFECVFRRRDNKNLWVSLNARAARRENGELRHIEGTMEDVTARRLAAEALLRVNEELKKALDDLRSAQQLLVQKERLSALGQMATGIAHDFNNALVPITGYTDLLLSSPEILLDRVKAQAYLELIRTSAKDGASIVARLREFYRTTQPTQEFTPVDLPSLIRQSILLTQPKWKRQAQAGGVDIKIVEELTPVSLVSGDESALREIFTNLIFNGVDAMPAGGQLTFRTRMEGTEVVVDVSDTGTGMTEEVRNRCLEPFFTTKGERGSGLGLSMVFGIVQRHGGTLDLQSRLGHGTTFSLRFPSRLEKAESVSEAAVTSESAALRVLLAEDDRQVRELLVAFLELDGHRVRSAPNGAEALALFQSESFDLVISDRSMPGMSGPQLAKEIKSLAPRTSFILLSGFNSPDSEEPVSSVDVMAAKPITLASLRQAIRDALTPRSTG